MYHLVEDGKNTNIDLLNSQFTIQTLSFQHLAYSSDLIDKIITKLEITYVCRYDGG